ncbi:unnamed protein product [Brassicogethes aeneus]|uniref:RRM domain-containing protein n=1 Tax=Brassicogethes aeneus TaxID=1431903 RepID=A0A9P0FN66_BRAAE|nr:unnamed protein product [Brassicogethes aeneus]
MSGEIPENPEKSLFEENNYSVVDSIEKTEETAQEENAVVDDKALTVISEDSTEKKDATSSETKEDSLIITHEEDLDIIPEDKAKVAAENPPQSEENQDVKAAKAKTHINYVWVSNISRHTKATSLKKLVSRHGKVNTAKIVTNGKSFFGYVAMENHEVALKCIEALNDTIFEGKKIIVSMDRPDTSKTVNATSNDEDKKSDKSKVKKDPTKKETKKIDVDWRYEYQRTKNEVDRLRRRLLDNDRRYVGAQGKIHRLEISLKDLQNQLRDERRRHNKDKEDLERKTSMELKKCVEDRVMINKELDDVRKLRESLKMKIKEAEMRHTHKSRSVSPKKKKWSERSPPPPPKLTDNRKRTADPSRHYYDDKKGKRSPPPQYNFQDNQRRHRDVKTGPPRPSTTPWSTNNFLETPWRPQNVPPSQQFQSDGRYQPYPLTQPFVGSLSDNFYRPPEYTPKYDSRKY